MRLKNILIAVKDVEKSKGFYHALFGLDVVLNQEEKVILTEGLVLQDASLWKAGIYARRTMPARFTLRSAIWKALLKSLKSCTPIPPI